MNKQTMHAIRKQAQAGFTLIELIVVIVILGILAATALPKFANLSGDARAATMKAVYGSLQTTVATVHGQYLINPSIQPVLEGNGVNLTAGYPSPDLFTAVAAGLLDPTTHTSNDYSYATTSTTLTIWPTAIGNSTGCTVVYTAAIAGANNAAPTPPTLVNNATRTSCGSN